MFSKYNYVYTLYKERSFTKAAQTLFISQPSLSVAIKNIESQLGAPLFERTAGLVTPTEIGREYILTAEKIMNAEHDFQNKINDIYELQTGEISVGGTNYLCSYVLPKIINQFTSLFPKINVTLTEANSKALREMVQSDQLDIIIDSFDEIPEGFEGEKLADEKILLCLPTDRKINNKLKKFRILPEDIFTGTSNINSSTTVPINMFKDENFVLLKSENDMYKRAYKVFQDAGVTPNVIFRVDQMNTSYALAESGMGACFVTDTLLKYGRLQGNVAFYDVDNTSHRTLYIAHKNHKYRTKAMSKFIQISKEILFTKN